MEPEKKQKISSKWIFFFPDPYAIENPATFCFLYYLIIISINKNPGTVDWSGFQVRSDLTSMSFFILLTSIFSIFVGKRKEGNRLMEQSLINSGLENHSQIGSSAIEQTRSERVDFCGIISRLNPKANKVSAICTDKMSGDDLFGKISKENTSVKIPKGNMQPNQGNDVKEMPVSKVSIPEWTDEQLSELFADY